MHNIIINKSSLLYKIIDKQKIVVNSRHKDYIDTTNMYVGAISEDGIIEEVEDKNKKYATLAGIKKIRIHDFRHSHASLLANEGINIQEIARRLGHSQIEVTWNTYSHLYPQEEERAIKILDKIV